MLLHIFGKEKDPLAAEQERLIKNRALLERETAELQRQLNLPPSRQEKTVKKNKPARFVFAAEEPHSQNTPALPFLPAKRPLRIQQRITRNRVIALLLLALLLLFLVGKTIF